MVGLARLLQLTLWVAAVDAFYPWFPECGDKCDGLGPGSKRGADARASSVDGITLGLLQKVPAHDEGPSTRSARAARAASRLAAKYAPARESPALRTKRKLRIRANEYDVIEPATPTAQNTAGVYQDGTDFSYFIQVGYGSSGKAMYMLLDSGAGTTWVMGPDCKSDACKMHNSFGPKDSTTFQATDTKFSINYGSGSVSGLVARDTVKVAGMEEDMSFGVASDTSDDFEHFPFDGILGLSMGKGTTDNFMEILTKGEKLPSNLFAVSLSRNTEVTNSGTITFGAIDPSKHVGDITYTAVGEGKNGFWAIPMDDMGFDDEDAGVRGRFSYIDTGTSFAFGPKSDVAALHRLVPGATTKDQVTYSVPCDTDKPLTITFSGVSYAIEPKDWVSGSGDSCTSNFYGHEVMKDSWLLGDVFLKNVYSVFDADNARIGFAEKPKAQEVASTTSSTSTASATVTGVKTTTDASGAVITTMPSAPSPVPPAVGVSGSGDGGEAVPETAGSPAPSSTSSSPGEQLGSNGRFVTIVGMVAVVVMMA